jgi:membrane protein required for colicin V production
LRGVSLKRGGDMNWLDIIIAVGLIAGVVLGFRRGFIREVTGLLGLIVGVIIAVNYVDWLSAKFLTHMRVSPHVVSFFSFILLFAAVFLSFKILGFLFYRIGSLTPLGKLDRMGGGIVGFVQAWIITGFMLLILMFFPLPQGFLRATDNSFFAPIMRGTIPMIYEETTILHPKSTSFISQISKSLKEASDSEESKYYFGKVSKEGKKTATKTEKVLAEIKKRFSRQEG